MKEVKRVYRIEHPTDRNGMWYTKDGVLNKRIHILCPEGISKDLPMPLNRELHRKDGKVWNSGGDSIENMKHWFTDNDVRTLYNNGFRLFEFHTTLFNPLEYEILFCREGIITQREIPLETIWSI